MKHGLMIALLVNFLIVVGPSFPAQRASRAPRVVWQTTVGTDLKPQVEAGRVLIHRERKGQRRYAVIDPATGQDLLVLKPGYDQARLSGLYLLAVPGLPAGAEDQKSRRVEMWEIASGKRIAERSAVGQVALGAVVGEHLLYGDEKGLHKVAWRSRKEVQQVPWKIVQSAYSVGEGVLPRLILADRQRVYFNHNGHVIVGRETSDLTRGWWHCCDAYAQVLDEGEVYGTGWFFALAALTPDNELRPFQLERPDFFCQFDRRPPVVAGEVLVAGGRLIKKRESRERIWTILSPYLFVFEKRTGRLRWKQPMFAQSYAVFDGQVAVCAGHGQAITGEGDYPGYLPREANWRLEIYDLSTGRRLWREEKSHAEPFELVGTGDRFLCFRGGKMICYHIDALDVFGQYVRGVHAKDGEYPTDGQNLGVEKPMGEGRVHFPVLVPRLKSLGYRGHLTIEREISGPRQIEDIQRAIAILEPLC